MLAKHHCCYCSTPAAATRAVMARSLNAFARPTHNSRRQSNHWLSGMGLISAAAAAAAAAEFAEPPDIDQRVYVDASVHPEPFIGPISAVNIPGKGRGLIATADLFPGQLLLVTPPVALIEGSFGDIPEHDELQELLMDDNVTLDSWQAAWLKSLLASTQDSLSQPEAPVQLANEHPGQLHSAAAQIPDLLPPRTAASSKAGESATANAPGSAPLSSNSMQRYSFRDLGMSEEQLWGAIVLNCYGEAFQDLPATLCSGATPNSQLGLFGPFSLLNHSCSPNAVNYTLREFMVVRACSHVPQGTELTINYLGRGALQPLQERQLELELCYGFKCCCARCQLEANVAALPTPSGSSIGVVLADIQQDVGSRWEPKLLQLLAPQEDMEDVQPPLQQQQHGQQHKQAPTRQHQQQLSKLCEAMWQQWQDLQGALALYRSSAATCSNHNQDGSSSVSSSSGNDGCKGSSVAAAGGTAAMEHQLVGESLMRAEGWIAASAFDLLGLLYDAFKAAGNDARGSQVLDTMLAACMHTCAGSDLYLFHALRKSSLEQQSKGFESWEAEAAYNILMDALRRRYGQKAIDIEHILCQMVTSSSEAAALVSF